MTCWAEIYDTFASEYHYTLDEFLGMTINQVIVLLNRIDRRRLTHKHQDYSFLASLHRVKIPSLEELGTVSFNKEAAPIDKKASKELDEYVKQRVAEKRAKWQQTNS